MTLCPWNGTACDCGEFPYKHNGLIPAKCETVIVDQMPELIPVRSVSDRAKKVVYPKYLADVKAGKYRHERESEDAHRYQK